ncbi:hypothetical protein P7C70_g8195, partial [Phenoliferia sp. Uapishka_3]
MSDPFTMPTKTSGRVILIAKITAKPGKGDDVQAALAAIRKLADSADEPGTHTYRTIRQLDGDSDVFMVFEEYELPNGIRAHTSAAPFQALGASGNVADLDIKSVDPTFGLRVMANMPPPGTLRSSAATTKLSTRKYRKGRTAHFGG